MLFLYVCVVGAARSAWLSIAQFLNPATALGPVDSPAEPFAAALDGEVLVDKVGVLFNIAVFFCGFFNFVSFNHNLHVIFNYISFVLSCLCILFLFFS